MTVTIHIGSMMFGFFLGYAAMAAIFLSIMFTGRWDDGFSKGWKSGKEYAENKAKKEEIEKGEQE